MLGSSGANTPSPPRQTRSTPQVEWVEKRGVWMPLGPVAGTRVERNRKKCQIDAYFASQNSYLETISENILSIEIGPFFEKFFGIYKPETQRSGAAI